MSEGEKPIDPKTGEGSDPIDNDAIEQAEENAKAAEQTEKDIRENKGQTEGDLMSALFTTQVENLKSDIDKKVDDEAEAKELGNFMDNLKSKIENNKDSEGRPDYQKVLDSFFGADGKFTPGDLYNGVDQTKANSALNEYIKKYKGNSVAAVKGIFPDFLEKVTKNPSINTVIDERSFTGTESTSRQEAAAEVAEKAVTPEAEQNFNDNAANRAAKDLKEGKTPSTGGRFIEPKTLLKLLSLLLSIGSIGIFAWWVTITAMNLTGCKEISCTSEQKFPTAKAVKCSQGNKPNIFSPNDANTINFTSEACQCDFPTVPEGTTSITKDNYSSIIPKCSGTETGGTNTCTNGGSINGGTASLDNLRPYGKSCERAGKFCSPGVNISCPFYSYSYSISTPFDALGNTYNGAMNGFNTEANSILDLLKKIGLYVLIGLGVLLVLYFGYALINKYVLSKKSKFGNINKYGNGLNKLSTIDFNSNYFLKGNCKAISNIPSKPILFKKFSKMSIG